MTTWTNPRCKTVRMKRGDIIRETHSDNLPALIITELTLDRARLTDAKNGRERWVERGGFRFAYELVARRGKPPRDPGWTYVV